MEQSDAIDWNNQMQSIETIRCNRLEQSDAIDWNNQMEQNNHMKHILKKQLDNQITQYLFSIFNNIIFTPYFIDLMFYSSLFI